MWSEAELDTAAAEARNLFRTERLEEPVELWKHTLDQYRARYTRLFDEYGLLYPGRLDPERISEIFRNELGDALRYLAGPPISEDDLAVLAEVPSLSPGRLAADRNAAARVLVTIVRTLDVRRLPWITEGREPTDAEKSAAILSSAVLIAAQKVSTRRRNDSKDAQEGLVAAYLDRIGYTAVPSKRIATLDDAPARGQYCAECMVGSRKADLSVRLFDGRLMPIECKVSNSALNSVKRVNNDAAVKAKTWTLEFGTIQIVPAAVLAGVFKVANLVQAQRDGLSLFWAHRLEELGAFIEATRAVTTTVRGPAPDPTP